MPAPAARFQFDVTLSYAAEDRDYVERVTQGLVNRGVRVFQAKLEEQNLWGHNLDPHLRDTYANRSRYTVLFISRNYARKAWATDEQVSAQGKLLAEHLSQILPARFDDTAVPASISAVGWLNLRIIDPDELAGIIEIKVKGSRPAHDMIASWGLGSQNQDADDVDEYALEDLPLLLYSVCTSVAFRINEQFYRQTHYVWCSPYFDMRRNPISGIGKSPPSSNPFEIYAGLLRDARSGDLHSALIKQNKEGILRGANARHGKGQITIRAKSEIEQILKLTTAADYVPLIYVIPSSGVSGIIRSATVQERAHPFSPEYIIEELPRARFDIITTEDPLLI